MFKTNGDQPAWHDLVPLSALCGEGWGWDHPFVTTNKAACDALAAELGDDVLIDDVGRRCVSRSKAAAMYAERRLTEAREREAAKRRETEAIEYAERFKPPPGVPVGRGVYDPDTA